MNAASQEELFTRVADSGLPGADQELVLAAAEGSECRESHLRGDATPASPAVDPADAEAPGAVALAYPAEIAVEGFPRDRRAGPAAARPGARGREPPRPATGLARA